MLTKAQLEQAVEWNREQRKGRPFWRKVQAALGAAVDGIPGPETARKAAEYQARFRLKIDGKVGPVTLGMLGLSGSAPSTMPPRGIWFDMAPSEYRDNPDKVVARMRELKLTRCQLMLTSSKRNDPKSGERITGPVFKHSVTDAAALASACDSAGIQFGLTVWPRPWENHTVDLVGGLGDYITACSPNRLEFDLEGNWTTKDVKGFPSLEQAGRDLVEFCREAFPGLELAVTTIPEHFELSGNSKVSHLVDVVIPQAYSIHKPGKAKYGWGEQYGPGIMQRWSLARARRVPGVKIECGLPVWAQKFPKKSVAASMSAAFNEAARDNDVGGFMLWSAKHVLRHWRNVNAARNFLRTLQ